jgi:hypothetical protein
MAGEDVMSFIDDLVESLAQSVSKAIATRFDERFRTIERQLNQLERSVDQFTNKLIAFEDKMMATFAEYQAGVDASLLAIAAAIASESTEIQAAIEAAKTGNSPVFEAALADLATKRQATVDAIGGLISTVPSPEVPTPVPPVTGGELPPVVEPVPEPVPTPSTPSPEVPVVIEPSPPDTGVEGGISIDPA